MGSLKTLALAGAVALAAGSAANAADFGVPPPPPPAFEPVALRGTISSGIYLRGDVGVGLTEIGKYRQDDVAAFGGSFIASDRDVMTNFAGAGVGFRFNNWFRVDGTFEFRGGGYASATDVVYNPFILGNQTNTYKGKMSSMVALFNAYVDLGTWKCLTPYIGAGIGYATNRIHGISDQGIVDATAFGAGYIPTLGTAGSATKGNVAWALMAGVGYEVNKNLTLEVGYRYLNLGDARSGVIRNAFTGQVSGPFKVKDIESHDFRVGMRWNFGDPDCCGPKEAPVSYEPPPVVRKF